MMCVCTFHMANVSMASTSRPSSMARMMTQRGTAKDTSGVPHNTRVPICRAQRDMIRCLEVLVCVLFLKLTHLLQPASYRGGVLRQGGGLDAVRHGCDHEGHSRVEDVRVVTTL